MLARIFIDIDSGVISVFFTEFLVFVVSDGACRFEHVQWCTSFFNKEAKLKLYSYNFDCIPVLISNFKNPSSNFASTIPIVYSIIIIINLANIY